MKLLFLLASSLILVQHAALAVAQADCYNSTMAILMAQLASPPVTFFKICPSTTITIGIPANEDFTAFDGGDVPLSIVQDNVTIQCGENGDHDDGCIFSGGNFQLITIPVHPFVFDRKISTNNLHLKGLTFTGEFTDIPGINSTSMLFSAPGTGMVIEHCVFESIKGDGVISNSRSLIATRDDYPVFSSEVTLKDCHFSSITYDFSIISNVFQTMNIEGTTFEYINYGLCDYCKGPIALVYNNAGIMKLTDSTFRSCELQVSAVYWQNNATAGVVSTFEHSSVVAEWGDTDIELGECEDGLFSSPYYQQDAIFANESYKTLGECGKLWDQVIQKGSANAQDRFGLAGFLSLILLPLMM